MAPTDGYGQRDAGAAQAAGHARGDALRLHLHLGAHLLEGAHVEVDRPAADAVAADEGHERLVGAVEQRARAGGSGSG